MRNRRPEQARFVTERKRVGSARWNLTGRHINCCKK